MTEIKRKKFKINENEEVNIMGVSQNTEKSDEDNKIKITRTFRFSMNEEVAVRKKTKTCSEEPLALKLEKRNNVRIFCSITTFEGTKQIIKSTVNKIFKINSIRNEG